MCLSFATAEEMLLIKIERNFKMVNMIIIYDANDSIITVLENAKSISAFQNGYLTFADYAYHIAE